MIHRKYKLPLAALALLPVAAAPAYAQEFEDLDVTMEVLDSEAELDVLVSQMRGPARSDADRDLGREGKEDASPSPFEENAAADDDGFDHDNIFRHDPLTREDDYESLEGEDQSLDLPADMPDPDPL